MKRHNDRRRDDYSLLCLVLRGFGVETSYMKDEYMLFGLDTRRSIPKRLAHSLLLRIDVIWFLLYRLAKRRGSRLDSTTSIMDWSSQLEGFGGVMVFASDTKPMRLSLLYIRASRYCQ